MRGVPELIVQLRQEKARNSVKRLCRLIEKVKQHFVYGPPLTERPPSTKLGAKLNAQSAP
jgi:hypothetical protein